MPAFIEKLVVAEALKGERVVRLKGGDPLLFDRGGEEVEHLRALGNRVEVVNGITSGLAAVTPLGVPLRDRDMRTVFLTGHAHGESNSLHWPMLAACAAQGITLVICIGVATIEALQASLLKGLAAHTPVTVVQHFSLPQQRHVVSTLAAWLKRCDASKSAARR